MPQYDVSGVAVELLGKGINASRIDGVDSSEVAVVSTADGLKAEISLLSLTSGEILVRLTEFLGTPPPRYSHLNRNGAMTVQTRDDGKLVALLRALRPGGKEYPTLNHVTWDELDQLFGENSKTWLESLGFETGTWSELNPKAGRFKASLAVAIEPDKSGLLILPWVLTRIIALMKKLGKPVVVVLN